MFGQAAVQINGLMRKAVWLWKGNAASVQMSCWGIDAQALAVQEQTEHAAFFSVLSDSLTYKLFASSINGKYFLTSISQRKIS